MKRIALIILLLVQSIWAVNTQELGRIINLAGKQRMLIQRMSKEALLISLQSQKEKNKERLKKDMELFERTLRGLQHGDSELGLVKVENAKIQNALAKLDQEWQDFKKHLFNILQERYSPEDIQYIKTHNLSLLRHMNDIVTMYVALNKSTKIKRAQAINLAGKERMLSQKIAKDVLLIQQGDRASVQALRQDKRLFAKILHGLEFGDRSLGLEPTRLPWILQELHKAQKMWREYQALATPKKLSAKELATLDQKSLALLAQMNKITKLYEKSINREKRARTLESLVGAYMQEKNLSKHVINLAGKQRMLTQRMSKLALLLALGYKPKQTKERLAASAQLYDKTLRGFAQGDSDLELPAATDPNVKAQIKRVEQKWQPFYQNVQKILQTNGKDLEALAYLIANNEALLKESHELVQAFKRAYKNDNFLENARNEIVDIAGRQRMLTQKMTKEKILVKLGIERDKNQAKLLKTVALFDTSLHDLMYGNKKKGLIKPTNKRLIAQYQKVKMLWDKLKPLYLKQTNSAQEFETIVEQNPILLKEMDRAVKLSETVLEY